MSPPAEPFTFEDLTEVYRREQRSKSIADVRKDLYPAIRGCLDELRRESEREFANDQFSTKAKLASNQLTKFQEKAAQIFEFRMEKILAMALRFAEGNRVDPSRLTPEEQEIFDRVSLLLKERHGAMLEGRTKVEGTKTEEPMPLVAIPEAPREAERRPDPPDIEEEPATPLFVPAVQPSAVEAPLPASAPTSPSVTVPSPEVPSPAPPVPAPSVSLEYVVLRILEDLPPFAGPDRNYKLGREDLVSLPPTIAKALVARKKAVMVQTGPWA